jgi:hypothetical protein
VRWTLVWFSTCRVKADREAMTNGEVRIERRRERAVFETDRHVIVGDVTLPPEGYQSRFSDALNRPDIDFIPLTNLEITARLHITA